MLFFAAACQMLSLCGADRWHQKLTGTVTDFDPERVIEPVLCIMRIQWIKPRTLSAVYRRNYRLFRIFDFV